MRLFEERNRDLASNNAEVGCVSGLEQLVKDALFLGCEVQVRMSLCYIDKESYPSVPPNCASICSGIQGRGSLRERSSVSLLACADARRCICRIEVGIKIKGTHRFQPWLWMWRSGPPLLVDGIRIVGVPGRTSWGNGCRLLSRKMPRA